MLLRAREMLVARQGVQLVIGSPFNLSTGPFVCGYCAAIDVITFRAESGRTMLVTLGYLY
jgi:hypothetical protein